jgi:hypothetical protein
LGYAACTAPPTDDDIGRLRPDAFNDLMMGTWQPLSRSIYESGDIVVKEHEIIYLKNKRHVPITVICRIDPIIIKINRAYSWLELTKQGYLCFNSYTNLQDAESKNQSAQTDYYCYVRYDY